MRASPRGLRSQPMKPSEASSFLARYASRLRGTDEFAFLLGAIHVPARVHPRSITVHENFSHPAGAYRSLTALFDFVKVTRINDRGIAVYLNLGLGEFQAQQF